MRMLRSERCAASDADLIPCMTDSITAMQQVILDKMQLFGSAHKAHLHQTPAAALLTNALRRPA